MAALEQYPDIANMPTSLVYELILNFAEAGEFQKATALFHNRFFQREEGGTDVRQVWIEVQIQYALSHGSTRTMSGSNQSTRPSSATSSGLAIYARWTRYVPAVCPIQLSDRKRVQDVQIARESSKDHFKQASEQSSVEDAVWAWKASQQLPGSDEVSAISKTGIAVHS